MANHVNIWVEVSGNAAAEKEFEAIVGEFEEKATLAKYGDTQLLSRLLFDGTPLSVHDPRLGGAKWAFVEEANGDRIQIVSGWMPAFGVAEAICARVTKFDPQALIMLIYEDEAPNFLGASIIGRVDGKVVRSDAWVDTAGWEISNGADEEEGHNPDAKTWEDVHIEQLECQKKAIKNYKKGIFSRFKL
jgi:hypothetical protein